MSFQNGAMICAFVRRVALLASLAMAPLWAVAASYQFPGNLPSGCSSTGASTYSCGSLTLNTVDTVTIVNKPASITFSGFLSTNGAKINLGGSPADLTLTTTGSLNTTSGAVVVANITTGTLSDTGGATLTGNVTASGGGSLSVGVGSTVTGNLSSGGGFIALYAGARATGNVSSSSGAIYLYNDSIVGGTVSCSCSVYAYDRVAVTGAVSATYFDNGGGTGARFGAISTTTGTLYLGTSGTSTGALSSASGNIVVYAHGTVASTVTTSDDIWIQADSSVGGTVSGRSVDASGIGSTFGGAVAGTTGTVTIGQNGTVAGNVTSTSGAINLYSGVSVSGIVTCDCSFTAFGSNVVTGAVWVNSFTDYGSSTFGASVTSAGYTSLGSNSRITGDLNSTGGSVYLNTSANVSQCTRTRGSDYITMYSGSRAGGVCCGGGTCGTSCVINFSGAARPAACSSALPSVMAEYRFEETSYNNTAGEVIDSSGHGRHGTTVGTVNSVSTGKICRGLSVPQNTSSTIQAFNTGIDVNSIGNQGTIAFWYKSVTSGTERRMLFDASPSSGGRFYLVRADANASVDLSFAAQEGLGALWSAAKLNTMSDATWTHIAVSWNFAFGLWATEQRLYVNGVLQDSAVNTSLWGALSTSIGSLYFGDQSSAGYTADSVNSANGTFDQISIYNVELTSTEVAALAAAAPACASLHHLAVTTSSASVVAGTATTFTITACADAACTTPYTGGVTGSLDLAGTGLTTTYTSGPAFTIAAGSSTTTVVASATPGGSLTVSTSAVSPSPSGSPPLYCGLGVAASSGASCVLTIQTALHHVALTSASATGLTCSPNTFTVTACGDAACSTPYTSGLSGTFTLAGSGLSVLFPSGAGFNIASGSSSATVAAQVVTAGTATAGVSGLSVTPTGSPAVYCGMGTAASSGGSCGFTSASAGFLLTVPNHVAGSSAALSVAAVKASDQTGGVCLPAFANVTKALTLKCSYSNPGSGTLPVRVGGTALNLLGNVAGACDASGQALNLLFNGSGVATSTVQYNDAGAVSLSANYLGTALTGDTGLQMAGSATFIAAPYQFQLTVPPGNKTAGTAFTASVSALNYAGTAMPNFGRESPPEAVTAGWVRTQPQGVGVADGTFSGSFGSFSGTASSSNLVWSEVGRGDLTVSLTSGNYLSTGYKAAGSTAGDPVLCAPERSYCTVPTGATAMILYGANGKLTMRSGITGSIMCDNSQFPDPNYGVTKACWYVLTSGSTASTTGAVGRFMPHHFELSSTAACGAFSYAGQPFGVTIRAFNAAGLPTINHDGGGNFTPAMAQALTLNESPALGLGTLSGGSVAASAFSKGVATVQLSYAFIQKLTAPQSLGLSALDTDGVASTVGASMALRSGRLVMSNAFGSEKQALSVPLRLQHWSGKSWILTGDDTCTVIPASAVARGSPINSNGSPASWTSSVSGVSLSGGTGSISLQPPSGGGTGSLDLALNLGSSGVDVSCLGSHPASTAAGVPWLRARAGSCASSFDRDPSARATFGVYAPETRKMIHLRELF